ncbi:helix-turn-helix domain-containing protein [Demequina sp. NBRC 110057]|uniref:helix-turn-helix domain-containing protein n=1 Tax=Demequina sp. NBRC 110057 TaxID=1570346 RepID=UPI0011778405|nr:helix-turn-helix domain-containing protein [Demequina sp. NBRC 110057]
MARLSDDDVVRLRERYAAGDSQAGLAQEFGVSQTSVSALVTGKTRADAGGPLAVGSPRPRRASAPASASPRVRLTDALVAQVRERVGAGEARAEVASALGISKASVDSIMSGRRGGAASTRAGALDDAARARIRTAHAAGQSQSAIARELGTSQQMVSKVLRAADED